MRRSPFIKPILPKLPTLGTKVRIKQGSSHHPVPFGSATGEIVRLNDDRSKGTLTISVRLPTGTVVKELSFADVVELESTAWTVTTHDYDRVVQGKDGHGAHDLSAPSQFRPAPNPPIAKPIMARADPARAQLELKAANYQKLAADAWLMMRVAGGPLRYNAAARAHARYHQEASKILTRLLDPVQPEARERARVSQHAKQPPVPISPQPKPVMRGVPSYRPRMDGTSASMIFKVSPDYASAYLARKGDTYGLAINGADLARLRLVLRQRPEQRSQVLADFYNRHL